MSKVVFWIMMTMLSLSAYSTTFKIDSFHYIDTSGKAAGADSKVVFNTDRELACDGGVASKIFINMSTKNSTHTQDRYHDGVYMMYVLWPSYFIRQAALINAEVSLKLGRYEPSIEACEINLDYNSIEKWRDPQIFNLVDSESNPIQSVSYHLKINDSYQPWVYADLNETVTCDGVTTNRIIPRSLAPDTLSYASPAEYAAEHTRSMYDLLHGKLLSYTMGEYHAPLNGCIIRDVVFAGKDSNGTGSISEGIAQCQSDPASCGLFSQTELDMALLMGFDAGKQSCIDSPENCGLYSEQDLNDAKSSAVEQCRNDPASCGLYSQNELDWAFSEGHASGRQSCVDDPASCDLFNQEGVNDTLLALENSIRAELMAIPGAYKSICKKAPEFSLCREVDKNKGKKKQKKKQKNKGKEKKK